MRKFLLFVRLGLFAALAVLPVACHPPLQARPVAPASPLDLSHTHADQWARELADQVGPRLTGSPQDPRAVAWATEKMTQLGLEHVHSEEVTSTSWVRGVETGSIVAPVEQPLLLTALGRSPSTPPQGLTADLVEFPTLEALRKAPPASLAGKFGFINQPMEAAVDGRGYGIAGPARFAGAAEASVHGALALLIRSVATSHDRFPHTGATTFPPGVTPIPAAALAVPDAELVHRLATAGMVRVHLTLGSHLGPEVKTANVVGEVVGRERPDEIVLLGAHLDSWDLGTGALDDGAGVGIVLEAARLIAAAHPHPRRTIRVVLFANEEAGLAGAIAYGKTHAAELEKHVLASECDVGTGRVVGLSYRAGPAADPALQDVLAPAISSGFVPAQSVKRGGESGADLNPLREAGVPFLEIGQDASHYFDYHHSANDTADKLDAEALAQVTAALATIAYGAAESSADFGRLPDADRKLAR